MTIPERLLQNELKIKKEDRDHYLAKVYLADILIAAFEYELGYSPDCLQAVAMISEGSPVMHRKRVNQNDNQGDNPQ